jgi:hypothetical protein
MSQAQGPISANDLMSKLVQAKKIMNKVDGGDYKRGQIDESLLLSDSAEYVTNESVKAPTKQAAAPSVDRINNSKLPDAIKKAMIEHPIEQMPSISLSETLDMDFVKGARRLMEQEGVSSKKSQPQQRQSVGGNIDMTALAALVENTVRKVMDEKLNQLLTAQQTQTISENLVLKVGDSVFKGKITGVNKSK